MQITVHAGVVLLLIRSSFSSGYLITCVAVVFSGWLIEIVTVRNLRSRREEIREQRTQEIRLREGCVEVVERHPRVRVAHGREDPPELGSVQIQFGLGAHPRELLVRDAVLALSHIVEQRSHVVIRHR